MIFGDIILTGCGPNSVRVWRPISNLSGSQELRPSLPVSLSIIFQKRVQIIRFSLKRAE